MRLKWKKGERTWGRWRSSVAVRGRACPLPPLIITRASVLGVVGKVDVKHSLYILDRAYEQVRQRSGVLEGLGLGLGEGEGLLLGSGCDNTGILAHCANIRHRLRFRFIKFGVRIGVRIGVTVRRGFVRLITAGLGHSDRARWAYQQAHIPGLLKDDVEHVRVLGLGLEPVDLCLEMDHRKCRV